MEAASTQHWSCFHAAAAFQYESISVLTPTAMQQQPAAVSDLAGSTIHPGESTTAEWIKYGSYDQLFPSRFQELPSE